MLPLYLVKILSENKRLMVNYRCGGVVNNQLQKGLLLSLPVKNFLIGEYLAKLQARTWLSRALSSSFSSVLARRILDAAYICTNRPTHNDVLLCEMLASLGEGSSTRSRWRKTGPLPSCPLFVKSATIFHRVVLRRNNLRPGWMINSTFITDYCPLPSLVANEVLNSVSAWLSR